MKHGMTKTKTFTSWISMKNRCFNRNIPNYKDYGGRGIKVCTEWINSFENFFRDMGERPEGKSLDRKDNDKGYCKSNCRWATSEEQNNNSRNNHLLTFKNKTQTIAEWARELGINRYIIDTRLKRGWDIKKTLTRKRGKYVHTKYSKCDNKKNELGIFN